MNRDTAPPRPVPWPELKARARHPALVPLFAFDWGVQWLAWLLGNWSFLLVLEYLGSFSVLIAVIFWFSESGDRVKQRHYQAWQVINTSQGQSGSGGRIDALQELNADRVALTGVSASSAFLQGIHLPHAKLSRADFGSADLRNSDLITPTSPGPTCTTPIFATPISRASPSIMPTSPTAISPAATSRVLISNTPAWRTPTSATPTFVTSTGSTSKASLAPTSPEPPTPRQASSRGPFKTAPFNPIPDRTDLLRRAQIPIATRADLVL